jgi:hypothetical protein
MSGSKVFVVDDGIALAVEERAVTGNIHDANIATVADSHGVPRTGKERLPGPVRMSDRTLSEKQRDFRSVPYRANLFFPMWLDSQVSSFPFTPESGFCGLGRYLLRLPIFKSAVQIYFEPLISE